MVHGFAWDLTLRRNVRLRGHARAIAWNVERGKRWEPLVNLLSHHSTLREADLLLLTELDVGMGRSGNRDTPHELAQQLHCDVVFANYHLVLASGDLAEQEHGIANTQALHGAALLSRHPIVRFAALALPEYHDKFAALEQRLGTKRVLYCEVLMPDGPLTVVVVHLDPFCDPSHRAHQARLVAEGLQRFGGERVLLGGDLNTHTWALGSNLGLATQVFYKLVRHGFQGAVRHYMTPDRIYERETFEALRRVGLRFESFVDPGVGTIYYDLNDPEVQAKTRSVVPRFVYDWLWRKLTPWNGCVPMRFDWFAGRKLQPIRVETITRPRFEGLHVSDHDPIVLDFAFEP